MMFPLAAFGGFNFDARLFPIQSINDAKNKSGKGSQANAACHKGHSGTASDD